MPGDLHIDDRLSHEAPERPSGDAETRERMKILEWVGQVEYFDDYDHKEFRRVNLLTRAPFDYTKWQASLWPDVGVEELSREAMRLRRTSDR